MHHAPQPPPVPERPGRWNRLAAGPTVLFVYGTLQFPEVLQVLIGRVPEHTPAAAQGWRAAALRRRVYPGLVPAAERVDGLLLQGLTAQEWRVLDDFEDDEYDLRRLDLADGGHGWAYVWSAGEAELLERNWSAEDFRTRHLAAYVSRSGAGRRAPTLTRMLTDHHP